MENLTDLEICKRIAEIEGLEFSVNGEHVFYQRDGWPCAYNPLVDDALCFQLMVKYKVTLDFKNKRWMIEDKTYRPDLIIFGFYDGHSINKAICLAIIK